jgi:hypothetical protein
VKTVICSFAVAAFLAAASVSFAAPAAAPSAFVSDKSKDYFGYFLPATPFKTGKWELKDVFVGGKDDLKSFETGKADKAFAGMMIEFNDVTSPKKKGEDGQEYYTRDTRILPVAYHVGMDKVTFAGTDKALGPVTFAGTFDKDFFKKPSADVPHPDDRPMLRGNLTIGGKVYPVAFNWFGGD